MDSTILYKRSKLYWINLTILFPAIFSLSSAVHRALEVGRSQDFQWSGAHLFDLHRDPYLAYLLKDPGHDILKSQIPNYLQELYVLLWPLGRMGEHGAAVVWVILNLLFATASVLLLGRIFRLGRGRTLLLGLIFATTSPFRVAIGNGQQSLLELMLLMAALAFPARAGWPLGLSYFKYSFTPIVFFYVGFRKGYRTLLISAILPLAGWLIFWLRVGGAPLQTAVEPALVGRVGVSPGTADLVTLLMFEAPRWVPFGLALTIPLSALLAYMIHRRTRSLPQAGAALAVCCLFLFPHLLYDLVLLIVPAALLLSKDRPARKPTLHPEPDRTHVYPSLALGLRNCGPSFLVQFFPSCHPVSQHRLAADIRGSRASAGVARPSPLRVVDSVFIEPRIVAENLAGTRPAAPAPTSPPASLPC